MPLSSGTSIGGYRISGLIGVGGMGEVYRARDEKLGRDVALKVLPAQFASDPDRFARFGREARLLASLNHPNIAGIYGLERHDDTHFLVLELIEGDTLAERIGRPIPVDQAIRLAVQIAVALEAAHGKGIIHRDLKPANVIVAQDGTVKVLDFGLAKAADAADVEPDLSHSPTLSMTATARGVILGTAGYMSPEQARGEAVTKQADIWAFGCILYEMLAGRRIWEGRSVTDVIASLVAREPDWTRLPANLHPRVRFVLERCLEKEAANRYHDIADVRVELSKALADPAGASIAPAPVAASRRRAIAVWVASAVALLALVGSAITIWLLTSEQRAPVARFELALPERMQRPTVPPFPIVAISKDGTRWAVSTVGKLWVRPLEETQARPLQGVNSQAVISPTFSPDGAWLAYVDSPGLLALEGTMSIRKVPVTGGSPVTVVPLSITGLPDVFSVDVSWDERNMLTWVQPEGIMQVSANGGTPELIVRRHEGESLASPQVLPGGDDVLFTTTRTNSLGRWDSGEIVVQAIGSTERTVVWRGGRDARYVPTGHIVYAQGTTLFAVPFNARRREVTGSQTPLVEHLSTPAGLNASDTAHFAVSDSGALLYLTGGLVPPVGSLAAAPPRGLAWVDRKGVETAIKIRPDDYTMVRLSPDGRKLALVLGNPLPAQSNTEIWVYDFATENSRQLTFGKGDDDGPVWSADSSQLYYRSFAEGSTSDSAVYSVSADGGQRTLIAQSKEFGYAMPWSLLSDGRTMAMVSARSTQDIDLATLDLQLKDSFQLLLRGPRIVSEPVISPNGQWLAYMEATGPGTSDITIRSFPDVTRQRYPVATGGSPVFASDGSELFFFDGGGLSAVPLTYQPTIRIGTAQPLFRGQYWYGVAGTNGQLGRAWDVDRRGERFLMIRLPTGANPGESPMEAPPIRLNVVLNWLNEVAARAATR